MRAGGERKKKPFEKKPKRKKKKRGARNLQRRLRTFIEYISAGNYYPCNAAATDL